MAYLPIEESHKRIAALRKLMESRTLDIALVYYDEFNIGNGWYLTGWCPQFESGAGAGSQDGRAHDPRWA